MSERFPPRSKTSSCWPAPGRWIDCSNRYELEGPAEASPGLHTSALMELGLILFFITFVVLACSKLLLLRLSRSEGSKT